MDIVDLRDIIDGRESDPETYDLWSTALLKDMGDSMEAVADNEPCMIAARDFKEYARELADDLGLTSPSDKWPFTCIDWNEAADELACDYSAVTVDGAEIEIRLPHAGYTIVVGGDNNIRLSDDRAVMLSQTPPAERGA